MDYKQVTPFNPAQAGTTPNMCLDNVRRGYGITNKYGSAWEAWQHTQQHADRNVPAGLAVPLFYSYTATIDGVTANYGHINVQLPDGRVWSDGNIYASIDTYLANHTPKFVGWGESVNDATIIKGEPMINEADVRFIFDKALGIAPTAEDLAWGVGKSWPVFMDAIYKRPEALVQDYDVRNLFTKFITTPVTQTDLDYARGMNFRKYIGLVMARPDCVSVEGLPSGATTKQQALDYINKNLQ